MTFLESCKQLVLKRKEVLRKTFLDNKETVPTYMQTKRVKGIRKYTRRKKAKES